MGVPLITVCGKAETIGRKGDFNMSIRVVFARAFAGLVFCASLLGAPLFSFAQTIPIVAPTLIADPLPALGIDPEAFRLLDAEGRASLLLERAQAGDRMAVYSALVVIQRGVTELRSRNDVHPFMRILPALHEKAVSERLEEIAPGYFALVARSLSNHSLRYGWINLARDNQETIGLFHRWADLQSIMGFIQRVRYELDHGSGRKTQHGGEY